MILSYHARASNREDGLTLIDAPLHFVLWGGQRPDAFSNKTRFLLDLLQIDIPELG